MLLGRPNVGKSTLFNRLCGRRTSLVDNRPGCTRDVVEDVGRLSDLRFRLLDTPGLELSQYRRGVARSALAADPRHHQVFSKFATDFSGDDAMAALCQQMCARTERLLERHRDPARNPAGLLALFVIDAVQGVMPGDREMVELLRRKTVPSVLVLNKCDAARAAVGHVEACAELGYDDCAAISAEQELGWADLYEALQPHVDAMNEVDAADTIVEEPPVAISVVGRPNVGKSTLLNALVGADRFLTAPFAGVTRDAVTVQSERFPNVLFTDTAGMRLLPSRTSTDRLQAEANQMARTSMRKANVCCLVLDAGLVAQATRETGSLRGALTDIEIKIIYEAAAVRGRPLMIALNKCDRLASPDDAARLVELAQARVRTCAPDVRACPVLPLSALHLTDADASRLVDTARSLYRKWSTRVPTATFSYWLREFAARHPPPPGRTFAFGKQNTTQPPVFTIYGIPGTALPTSYQRQLINDSKATFGLEQVPVRVRFSSQRRR